MHRQNLLSRQQLLRFEGAQSWREYHLTWKEKDTHQLVRNINTRHVVVMESENLQISGL